MRRGGLPPGVNSFSQVVWPWGTAYGRIAPDTYILRNREGGDWLKERGVWRPLTEVKPDAGLRFPDDSQLYGFLNWRCIGDVGEIASGNDPCRAAPVRGLKLRILKIVLLLAMWVFLLWLHFSGAESRIFQAMGL